MQSKSELLDKDRPEADWMQTHTGKKFYPFDPKPDQICMQDIAHALSMQCRFGGHSRRFYSVAEHCILASRLVSSEDALWALLHDAAEAYLSDLPKPFKDGVAKYINPHEKKILQIIAKKYNLSYPYSDAVKKVDWEMCVTERFRVMQCKAMEWPSVRKYKALFGDDALNEVKRRPIMFWDQNQAKRMFLDRFTELV